MNQTRVFELSPAQAADLERNLQSELPADADWRPVPHARFSVKARGLVVTCYRSGKLVLQGRDPDGFAERYLAEARRAANREKAPELEFDGPTIASDEAGKGDYFGPLVVAAVHADPADADALARLGVADSKTLSDARVLTLAGQVTDLLDQEIVVLEPEDYNFRYAEVGNLNELLAEAHARALEPLIRRHGSGPRVLVDKFAAARVLERALARRLADAPEIVQVPRAEAHPAVAAASILARAGFLEGLRRCEDACGTDLHKGAGEPVDRAARRVDAIGGRELLQKVAKMHFKNTSRLRGRG